MSDIIVRFNNTQGVAGAKGDQGTSLNYMGAYNSLTSYLINDFVEYNGSGYVCILASTGNLPTDTIYFGLIASKGDTGISGGDMLKLDNLSGLTNYTTARTNLGVTSTTDLNTALSGKVDKVTGSSLIPDIDIIRLANTSNTNTGDNAVNSLYSGLEASKVDKVTGKGLSTEDYTTTEKTKLSTIADNANVGVVPNIAITGATKTKITYDSKGLVTSGADLIESDIPTLSQSKITNLTSDLAGKQPTGSYEVTTNKGQVNGYASLDSTGKIPTTQIPDLAITEFLGNFTSTATALANGTVQASQKGDWFTVDTNGGESWIVTVNNPTLIGHITQLKTPTSGVSSVNNQTGAVVLSTNDIADFSNKRYVTDAEKTILSNTSNTNSGDNATNSQYSGLATSKEDTIIVLPIAKGGTNSSSQTAPASGIMPIAYFDGTKITTDTTPLHLGYEESTDTVYTSHINIKSNTTTTAKFTNTGANSSTGGSGMIGLADDGTAMATGERLGFYTLGGAVDTSHTTDNSISIEGFATENWNGTSAGSKIVISNTPNGSTARQNVLEIGQDKSAVFSGNVSALNLSGSNSGDQIISDATITTTDITTNNATISKHGFLPKLSNNATQFLDGLGNFSTPSGIVNSYTSTTFTSQTNVVVNHGFGTYPVIQILGSSNEVIIPESIINNTVNQFTVIFKTSTTGVILSSIGSPQASKLTTATGNYTIVNGDQIIECTGLGSTITLPTAIGIGGIVFKIDNNTLGDIYINTTSSQTIQGELIQTLPSQSSVTVYSNGSNWRVN